MKFNPNQPFSLRSIVGELIASYKQAGQESAQIINNVSSDLEINKRVDSLAPLIEDLLSIISNKDSSSPVLISAIKINGGYKLYAPNANNLAA